MGDAGVSAERFGSYADIVVVANNDRLDIAQIAGRFGPDTLFVFFNRPDAVLKAPFGRPSLLVLRSDATGALVPVFHDPAHPVLLGSQPTPNNFTHNCWLDDSGQYLFTTDEKPNSFLAAYDVSDPTDILPLDKLQTDPGSDAIIHNTYWLNGYVVQSYYTEGVSIYDVHDPTNIIEVGRFEFQRTSWIPYLLVDRPSQRHVAVRRE